MYTSQDDLIIAMKWRSNYFEWVNEYSAVEVDSEEQSKTRTFHIIVLLCPIGLSTSCTPFSDDKATSHSISSPIVYQRELSIEGIGPNETISEPIEVSIPMALVPDGTYSVMVSIATQLHDVTVEVEGEASHLVYTVVNIPKDPERQIIVVQDTNEPVSVDDGARTFIYIMSGLGGLVIHYLLCETIRHRQAQVFELTQGKFLIAMLVAALIATVSLFVFEPKSDVYCHLPGPLVIFPLHLMFSICLGRLWRIRSVISPLLLLTLEKEEHWSEGIVKWVIETLACDPCKFKRAPKQIRRQVSNFELTKVVFGLVLPQLVVQICTEVFKHDNGIVINILDDGVETQTCRYDPFSSYWHLAEIILLFLLLVTLFFYARASRDLPSLFNETHLYVQITSLSFITMFLSCLFLIAARNSSAAPNLQFLVAALGSLLLTLNTSWKIVWPKIQIARRGDPIVVTKLFADHNRSKKLKEKNAHSGGAQQYSNWMMPSGASKPKPRPPSPPNKQSSPTEPAAADRAQKRTSLSAKFSFQKSSDNLNQVPEDDDSDAQSTASEGSSVILIEDPVENKSFRRGEGSMQVNRPSSYLRPLQSARESLVGFTENQTSIPQPCDELSSMDGEEPWKRAVHIDDPKFKNSVASPPGEDQVSGLAFESSLNGPLSLRPISHDSSKSPNSDDISPDPRHLRRRVLQRNTSSRDRKNEGHASSPMLNSSIVHHHHHPLHKSGQFKSRRTMFQVHGGTGSARTSTRLGMSTRLKGMFGGFHHTQEDLNKSIEIGYNPNLKQDTIVISEFEPPARRLLLRMIDVQRMLKKVNQSMLTGLAVGREEWAEIRELCIALGDAFRDEVRFDWEEGLEEEAVDDDLDRSLGPEDLHHNQRRKEPSPASTMQHRHNS